MLKPIKKHHVGDCAVCAIAMTLGLPYWKVVQAAEIVCKNVRKQGLWNTEIDRTIKQLGIKAKRTRRFNVNEDTGLLTVDYGKGKGAHAVSLFNGTIIDPEDTTLWEPEVYFTNKRCKPRSLIFIR